MIQSFEAGREVARRIPDALFYPFEGRGHLPNLTAFGEFCRVLREFVHTGEVKGAERLEKEE